MRVEAKHPKTGEIIRGKLLTTEQAKGHALSVSARHKLSGLHPRELVLLQDSFPAYQRTFQTCYPLREMIYILKEED